MKMLFFLLVVGLTAGCATNSATSEIEGPNFHEIASAWEGAHINEMIRQWGDPRVIDQDEALGGAGTATWVEYGRYFGSRRSKCQATATFGRDGIIKKIETDSVDCRRVKRSWFLGHEGFEQLERQDEK